MLVVGAARVGGTTLSHCLPRTRTISTTNTQPVSTVAHALAFTPTLHNNLNRHTHSHSPLLTTRALLPLHTTCHPFRTFSTTTESILQPELDFEKVTTIRQQTEEIAELVKENIKKARWGTPTPAQKYAVPLIIANRDVMCCAQTGSGKTAAFLFPMITRVLEYKMKHPAKKKKTEIFTPLGLILVPTRELACQVEEHARQFGKGLYPVSTVAIYGGVSPRGQLVRMSHGCDIIVATPGRLSDFIQRGVISLQNVATLVLDEADRMLDMGFEPQIREIISKTDLPDKTDRQTTMFSATFPKEIRELATSFLKSDYIFVAVGKVGSTTELVSQRFIRVEGMEEKRKVLLEQIQEIPGRTLVFVETKLDADILQMYLKSKGISSTSIHGDRAQAQRAAALAAFAQGEITVLVATDVAARGLDVKNIAHVINFDMPKNIDSYVHRIGRTGRAGVKGISTALITSKDLSIAKDLVEVLRDSSQEIPDWLANAAAALAGRPTGGKNSRPIPLKDKFGAPNFLPFTPKSQDSKGFGMKKQSTGFGMRQSSQNSTGFGTNQSQRTSPSSSRSTGGKFAMDFLDALFKEDTDGK